MTIDLGNIIDAHVHLWDPLTTPRDASSGARIYRRAPRAFEALFPLLVRRADRDFIGTPRYVGRPFLPSDLREAAEYSDRLVDVTFTLESYVHIEASWRESDMGSVNETIWVSDVAESEHPPLAAMVAHLDPRWPQAGQILDAHLSATSTPVVGVRCSAAHHPQARVKSWIDDPHAYSSPGFLRGFSAIAERNLTFDAWVYAHQLPDLVLLAKEYPETRIILDHYCCPPGLLETDSGPSRSDTVSRWVDHLSELAGYPNVFAKHSGIGMPVLGYPIRPTLDYPRSRPHLKQMIPYIALVTRLFGTHRIMFGSNTPMDLPTAPYPDLVSTVAQGVLESGASTSDLANVFRNNARAAYRLEP